MAKLISVVIPIFNEQQNISLIYKAIKEQFLYLKDKYDYEIIFVNDGSIDESQEKLFKLAEINKKVKIVCFSRNFGKEFATSAGLYNANGEAVIVIDADMQHPPEKIPELLFQWENGKKVVIGIRTKNKGEGLIKNLGSKVFYWIINIIAETKIRSGGTDFRLIDREVVNHFNQFTEKNRMTRGLIDWLGFEKAYVEFQANPRVYGKAGYSLVKLIKLAMSTFVANSLFPLKFAGYLGLIITFVSGLMGFIVLIEQHFLDDPWHLQFTGTAQLAILIIFFIGIVLSSLGLIALYVGNIHQEVLNRPLYIVSKKINFDEK